MDFFERTYGLISKYNQKAKKAKYYGTDDLLYPAEVHIIEIIGAHDAITTTEIANTLGITKGAVSQTTNKLVAKNLIIKEVSAVKANEVYISLTEKGKTVFDFHREMHRAMRERVDAELSELTPESRKAIDNIVSILEESLKEI